MEMSRDSEPTTSPQEEHSGRDAFSLLTGNQKRWIALLVAFAGMFSPMSSFIYYPAIDSLAAGLHVSVEMVNITVTSYLVVSGIAPSLLGNAADMLGRRPIYVLAFMLYFGANLGLALQNSFPGLLSLRMLQEHRKFRYVYCCQKVDHLKILI